MPVGGNMDHHHSKMSGRGETKRRNDPEEREGGKTIIEVELDLIGGYSRKNMPTSSLGNGKGRIFVVFGQF